MSHASDMLSKIEAVLEGRIDADVESYQIAGRQITKIPIPELIKMRQYYKSEVAGENAKTSIENGDGNPRKILTRF